jgi:Ser/Thr protein kinase RdoA (MazF antagonist)
MYETLRPAFGESGKEMSFAPLEQLSEWLLKHYGLQEPIRTELLRSYTNDVYQVDASGERFALKLYGRGWRTEQELSYEVDLLRYLASRGVEVAQPIAGSNRRDVQTGAPPDDTRLAVLFDYVRGVKPRPPFLPELDERVGRAAATIHEAADDFVSPHSRRSLDIPFLIEKPAELVLPLIPDRAEREAFRQLADRLARSIRAFADRGLEWGPIHGDLTLDNLHVTPDNEIILYDFDSGGPGWRAADLPGWAAIHPSIPDAARRSQAFLRGYRSIRPIGAVDIEAAPALFVAFEVWGLEIELQNRIQARGSEAVQSFLSIALPELHRHAALI